MTCFRVISCFPIYRARNLRYCEDPAPRGLSGKEVTRIYLTYG